MPCVSPDTLKRILFRLDTQRTDMPIMCCGSEVLHNRAVLPSFEVHDDDKASDLLFLSAPLVTRTLKLEFFNRLTDALLENRL